MDHNISLLILSGYYIIGTSNKVKRKEEMQSLCASCAPSNAHAFLPKKETPNPKLSSRIGLLNYVTSPLMAAVLTLSPLCYSTPVSHAELVDIQRGAAVFNKACIGCHDGGGNILQPGATLFMKDLQRNGVDTEDGLYGITYYGKGRMPGFGEKCMPRGQCTFGPRLQDEEIKLLASFVKLQAEKGWPNVSN